MRVAVVVAVGQHGGHEVAVVVLEERDGMCPVPGRAGVNLVGLREVSGPHAVGVAAAPFAFVRHTGAANPC